MLSIRKQAAVECTRENGGNIAAQVVPELDGPSLKRDMSRRALSRYHGFTPSGKYFRDNIELEPHKTSM
jgi:hypothetical protein